MTINSWVDVEHHAGDLETFSDCGIACCDIFRRGTAAVKRDRRASGTNIHHFNAAIERSVTCGEVGVPAHAVPVRQDRHDRGPVGAVQSQIALDVIAFPWLPKERDLNSRNGLDCECVGVDTAGDEGDKRQH